MRQPFRTSRACQWLREWADTVLAAIFALLVMGIAALIAIALAGRP